MKKEKKAFGIDEEGSPLIPPKFSNVKMSRIHNYEKMGGCPYCFPHGHETVNSRWNNQERSWKRHRKTQWRMSLK